MGFSKILGGWGGGFNIFLDLDLFLFLKPRFRNIHGFEIRIKWNTPWKTGRLIKEIPLVLALVLDLLFFLAGTSSPEAVCIELVLTGRDSVMDELSIGIIISSTAGELKSAGRLVVSTD